jgi:hypothetical protein
LAALAGRAEAAAQRIADEYRKPMYKDPDAWWNFEVVDVRLTSGPAGESTPESAWLAYGTLVSIGGHPWAPQPGS